MKNIPVKLPVLHPFEVDKHEINKVLGEMKNATTLMTFYSMPDGKCKYLFSGFGENEFSTLMIMFSKSSQIFDFFKAAIVNTKLYQLDGEMAMKYTATLLRYMKTEK